MNIFNMKPYPLLKSCLLALGIFGSAAASLHAQPASLLENPGYLHLDEVLENNQQYLKTEVYLKQYILRMVARVAAAEEPEFAQMLNSIQLIRVMTFEYDQSGADNAEDSANKLLSHMNTGMWDTLVRSRDEGNTVNISMQSNQEDIINALAVVTWNEESMTVVNLVGEIDLDMLARLGEQFDIGPLQEYPAGEQNPTTEG